MDVTYRIHSAGALGLLMKVSSICVRKQRNRWFREVAEIAANYHNLLRVGSCCDILSLKRNCVA